jgi:nucleoside phosphorylase
MRSLGARLARDKHVLWVAWSEQNYESQLGLKETGNHPYDETADYYALLGYLETLDNGLYEQGSRVRLLLAKRADQTAHPFAGGIEFASYIAKGWVTIDQPIIEKTNWYRSHLLKHQAHSADAFFTVGGGKASNDGAEPARKRGRHLPLPFFNGKAKEFHENLNSERLKMLISDMDARGNSEILFSERWNLEELIDLASAQVRLREVDIGIITIRSDEEKAVRSRLGQIKLTTGRHRTYGLATVTNSEGVEYRVASVRSLEQGPIAGQDVARDLIEDCDPTLIVVVGICGGVPSEEYTLGDVIFGKRLHDFAVGAFLDSSEPESINQGGPMDKRVQDLAASLGNLESLLEGWETADVIGVARPVAHLSEENLYGPPEWQRKTARAIGASSQRTSPIVFDGAIASSGFLIKDTKVIDRWRASARDLIAVEMELSGIYRAAERLGQRYPILAIRGFSDIVGLKRESEWTLYACNTAASFLFALLKKTPVPEWLVPKHRKPQ